MTLDPIMPVLTGTACVIFLLGLVMRRLRQPHVVVYLVAGVLLGPDILGVISDGNIVSKMGAIGVDLLLFFVGMEVSPRRLVAHWKVATLGTLLQITASVVCVLALGAVLGWRLERCILLGFVISLSSSAIVIRLLQERQELGSRVGQSVVAVLLAQDVALVPMLIVVGLFRGETPALGPTLLQLFGGLATLGLLALVAGRKKGFNLPFGAALEGDRELQVFGAAVVCLGLAFVTSLLGLSTALGAFVAGVVVGRARETGWVQSSLEPFRVVFVALFFVAVGLLVDLDFLVVNWRQIGLLVLVVFVVNMGINTLLLRIFGGSWSDSFYGGALLSQVGEFSFVLAAVGYQTEMVSEFSYKATMLVISLTLLLSPGWVALVRGLQRLGSRRGRSAALHAG